MSEPNPKVDWFFNRPVEWKSEYARLREIALDSGLTEELKWGCPCYTHDKKNIVLIHGFNEYCALLFFKGAILKDPHNVLIQQTENVQSSRQIRVASVDEINRLEPIILAYIREAIVVEEAGLRVTLKPTSEFTVVEEFQQRLDQDAEYRAAFEALTPGRQRGYLLYFAGAKQAKTREARIEKSKPMIMEGKGLQD
ncbi:MAG: YdeI/OmpD-associated family protein [Armatimonadetes bacterium]|nr:YdeI/OmpD-associated family protein [Armatimonadota bacterium]